MLKQFVKRALGGPHQAAAIRRLPIVRGYLELAELREWRSRQYEIPAPPSVKRRAIARNAIHGGTFIEAGTFLGDTAIAAQRYSKRVVTIEASPALCADLRPRLARYPNIELIEGRSQEVLPDILTKVAGDVTFWLDAHASGGITFDDPDITSIKSDLSVISSRLDHMDKVVVMIDDVRGFGYPPYPDVSFLLEWAKANAMKWKFELDMLCMERSAP
jgi:hypothetical protein